MMLIKKRLYPVLLTLFITMLIILLNKQENNVSSSSSSITKSRNANNDFLVWNYSLEDNLNGKWRHLTATQVNMHFYEILFKLFANILHVDDWTQTN